MLLDGRLLSKHVLVVGRHPVAFLDHLRNAGFQYSTYEKYEPLPVPPGVVALIGHDDVLANPAEIRPLLDSHVVLALFSPSAEILRALRESFESVVDVTKLEIKKGVPIIIHKIKGEDWIHIALGFTILDDTAATVHVQHAWVEPGPQPPDAPPRPVLYGPQDVPEPQTFPPKASRPVLDQTIILRHAVRHIVKAQERIAASEDAANDYNNDLAPPAGTNYFNQTTIYVSVCHWGTTDPFKGWTDNWDSPITTGASDQCFNVDWTITLYSYATGALPSPNNTFKSRGGVVYVIAVHSGQVQRDSSDSGRRFGPKGGDGSSEVCFVFLDHIQPGLEDTTGLLYTYQQLPYSGSQSGTDFNYDFKFSQKFNMYENNGKTAVVFPASFGDSYTLPQFQQTSLSPDNHKYHFSFDYKNLYDRYAGDLNSDKWKDNLFDYHSYSPWYKWVKSLPADNIPFHGFSMFSSDVGKTTLNCVLKSMEIIGFQSSTAGGLTGAAASYSTASWSNWVVSGVPLDLTFGG